MNSEATSGFMVSLSIFLIWEEFGKKFSSFRGFPDAEIVLIQWWKIPILKKKQLKGTWSET